MKHGTIALLILGIPASAWARPDWVDQSERRVVGGDIIHWGTGAAETPEVALFKARQMAIRSLIEECGGIANKDIIPQKQYLESEAGAYKGFATVSLTYSSCEAGKHDPDRKLENPKIVEEQKQYEKMLGLGETPLAPSALESGVNSIIEEIGTLKTELANRPAPQPSQAVRLPATNSMREYCVAQANNMRTRLQFHAAAYNGNVTAPEMLDEYNAYQRQTHVCARME